MSFYYNHGEIKTTNELHCCQEICLSHKKAFQSKANRPLAYSERVSKRLRSNKGPKVKRGQARLKTLLSRKLRVRAIKFAENLTSVVKRQVAHVTLMYALHMMCSSLIGNISNAAKINWANEVEISLH